MEEINKLRTELAKFDENDLCRLQARSFAGIPPMNYAFFPGGNGLYLGKEAREFPRTRTLILGSDFACLTRHVDDKNQLLIISCDERGGPTWKPMLDALRQTPILPEESFFTNAWPVMHLALDGERGSNDNPPIDFWRCNDSFMQRCIDYFRISLQVVKPKLIVALGKGPAVFLGEVWPVELKHWKFPSEYRLAEINWRLLDRKWIAETESEGRRIHCVAVNHPSKGRLNAKHRASPYKGLEGEVRLLNEAARQAGIE